MSLKAYLQSLISVLLKKSVENTSPSSSLYSEVVITTGERILSPVDGFVRVNTSQATKSANYVSVISEIMAHQHTTAPGYVNRIDLPVKKGSYVQVAFDGYDSVAVGFVARVGGGIKRLLSQVVRCVLGGAICLKTSSAHSLKRYLRTRRATLALKRSRKKRTELISANKPQVTTQPLAMDISVSMCMMSTRLLISIQKTMEYEKLHSEFRTVIFQVLERYLLEKEIEHSGTETKSRPSYGSFLLREVNSLIATEVCHV